MIKSIIKNAIFILAIVVFAIICPNCKTFAKATNIAENNLQFNAKAVYLIDAHTGTFVYGKNELDKLPIASMTKLATLSVVFNQINSGALSADDIVTVSQNAASTEGSSAFLDAGSKYSVESLIKTIVVVSANDSCVALAEHICGSEKLFANKMNELIDKLKLKNSHFENATGLPSDNHYSCAHDMAKIYITICNNPMYQKFAKIWMEDFIHPSGRITGLVNTNRLIKTYDGCTGGKTGHTNEAKYCLTASATRNGTSLVAVVIGAENSKSRFEQTQNLFDYGFANFASVQVVDRNVCLAQVDITGAKEKSVEVYAKEDYMAFTKKDSGNKYKTHIVVNENLSAPFVANDCVGKVLILDQNNIVVDEIDLIVKVDVEKIKYKEILKEIFTNW